jgi:hypothetical protein
MSELEQTRQELNSALSKIPSSGSFEAARLSRQVLELSQKIVALHAAPQAVEKIAVDQAEVKVAGSH